MSTRRHERPLKRLNPSGKTVWVARYTGVDGRRRSAGTFPLQRLAQDAIDAAYLELERAPSGSRTVGSYASDWLSRRPRAERTAASYEGRLRAMLDVELDGRPLRDYPLGEFRRPHASQLLDVLLREQGRAARGAKGCLLVLSALFSDAVEDGLAEFNPLIGMRVRSSDPRVSKPARKVRVFSLEEMRGFAAAAGEFEPMVRVLSDCGLRIGELFPLERGDLSGDVLEVRRTSWRGRVTAGTKTDHGEAQAGRVVPVGPSLAALLDSLPPRIDTRLLFPSPSGVVWGDRRWYDVVWYPAQKRSGLDIRPHEMRHSYVSLMRAAGVDPADLAAACGHSVETATAHYTHATGQSFDAIRRALG